MRIEEPVKADENIHRNLPGVKKRCSENLEMYSIYVADTESLEISLIQSKGVNVEGVASAEHGAILANLHLKKFGLHK